MQQLRKGHADSDGLAATMIVAVSRLGWSSVATTINAGCSYQSHAAPSEETRDA
jgi:hypothetical protein